MKKKLTQQALFQSLETFTAKIPDDRKGNNTTYSIRDAMILAFSCFFLHSPSLDSHLELLSKAQGKRNKRLFSLDKIPCANQIRNILDPLDPKQLFEVQDHLVFQMQRSGVLREFYVSDEIGYAIATDGTEYFRSKRICCPGCCQVHHSNGSVDYQHRLLLSGLVHPTENIFLPISQEFIVRQDGVEKEDCEINAAKRWLKDIRRRHPQMKFTILADDIQCKEPNLKLVLSKGMNFIVSCKPGSHKTTFEWIDMARFGGDLGVVKVKRREGKHWLEETYEYANKVPLKDGAKVLEVGFVEVTTRLRDTDQVIGRQSFATNLEVTAQNCEAIGRLGRRKWKIENEGNNTLKNLGYHLEHNYGHGKQNLSAIFVMLMLIAFMMHVILHLVQQEGFAAVRSAYSTLRAGMEAIRGAFRLIACSTWEEMYQVCQEGIDSS